MLRQLGQAALSLDSPDRSAAQLLASLHGPEVEHRNAFSSLLNPNDDCTYTITPRSFASTLATNSSDEFGNPCEEREEAHHVRP